MDPTRLLFTRQQISHLVPQLDDATLNYWMREGVIRAAEGGGGRGQHRRFRYSEVNLAAILNEVRQYGAGVPSLKSLSSVFHTSEDWALALGVNLLEVRLLYLLHEISADFERNGYYPAPAEEMPHRDADDVSRITGDPRVRLNSWSEISEWLKKSNFYRSELGARFEDAHFELFHATNRAEVKAHWTTLMHIARMPSEESAHRASSIDLTYFTRDLDGRWTLSGSVEVGGAGISHIAINIPRLLYRTWNGEPPAPKTAPEYTDQLVENLMIYGQRENGE